MNSLMFFLFFCHIVKKQLHICNFWYVKILDGLQWIIIHCNPSKIFKSSIYQLLVWRAINYYVRTYANISVILKFCYFCVRGVRKNCLTYVQPTMIVFYL